MNLLNLDTGSNAIVSTVSFIGTEGNALLSSGRLFWIDDKENRIYEFAKGAKKPILENPRIIGLLGLEGDDLYCLTKKGRSDAVKAVLKYSLAKGTNQELEAMFSSPDRLTMSDGILCWIDNRDGIDDVFALALKDGKERRISTGFGH